MTTPSETYPLLVESILARYRMNSDKSLLDVYKGDHAFTQIDKGLLEFIYTNREGILSVLNDPDLSAQLVNLFVRTTIDITWKNNQFVTLNSSEETILQNLYAVYLVEMRTALTENPTIPALEKGMGQVLQRHFSALSQNISRFFDPELARKVDDNIILRQVVCSEYSPEFQMNVLGLRLSSLMQPVLDVGCGKTGQFVEYLQQNGADAQGIDRLVDPLPSLMETDWFDFNFQPKTWGTIVSHMAFSNHFAFHHGYKNGTPEKYARLYMKILSSLKPGGVFVYSPGLPFIESFLPTEIWKVERHGVAQPYLNNLEAEAVDIIGVTRVTRL
jgi:SAM-dependent methyltransferase